MTTTLLQVGDARAHGAPCLRATPSGAPPSGSQGAGRCRGRALRPAVPQPGHRSTSAGRARRGGQPRQAPAAAVRQRPDPALAPEDGGAVAGRDPARTLPRWLRRDDLRAASARRRGRALGLRLGLLEAVPTSEEATLVGHLGPDLLGPDWDLADGAGEPARHHRAHRGGAARPAQPGGDRHALGQRVAVPVPPRALDTGRRPRRRRPRERWSAGPTPARPGRHHAVQSSTGNRRKGEEHYVHARSGRPCRRCGTAIRVAMIGPARRERTMFYCPGCQHGLGPTDDGRPQRPLGSSAGRTTPYRRA